MIASAPALRGPTLGPSLALRRTTTARPAASRARVTPVVAAATRERVVPKPSYNIPIVLGALAGTGYALDNMAVAGVCGVLGAFLAIQASRVKFVFDDDALEVLIGEEMEESENKFVGGANRWKYETFTNWEFWWPGFPVLVYFKETQTKPEGQIHFFPIIFDGEELYNLMSERCGSTMTSGRD